LRGGLLLVWIGNWLLLEGCCCFCFIWDWLVEPFILLLVTFQVGVTNLFLILVLGTRGEQLDFRWLINEVGVFLLEALPLCILCQVETIVVKVH